MSTKFALIAVLFAAAFSGFTPARAETPATKPAATPAPQVSLIEPATLQSYLKAGVKIYLVDVRRQDEFDQGHIAGATLLPLETLPDTYSKLPKSGKLIVYCRTGHRSGKAVQFLMEHGYTNAVSLNGGYTAWTAAQH